MEPLLTRKKKRKKKITESFGQKNIPSVGMCVCVCVLGLDSVLYSLLSVFSCVVGFRSRKLFYLYYQSGLFLEYP